MLTKLDIRNFKRFDSVSIELGSPVVFVGPNNSGKTSALQALALWDLGVKRWLEKRGEGEAPKDRPGVAINRRDFVAAPIPAANLLWRDLATRATAARKTSNIRVDITVTGFSAEREWTCGMEFDYANEESFYCRPLRTGESDKPERMAVPAEARAVRVAFLPPMSGLADREFAKQGGEISYLIGQGRTAEVLRNLCLQVRKAGNGLWDGLCEKMQEMFGIELLQPEEVTERAEITMSYRERGGVTLDLSCAGRGVQQTLLLLAHLAVNRGSVLLLDEPDAHLEILRQRQIYRLLAEAAEEQNSQVIIASHSEVILNEAAGKDVVVAFLGAPHRIDDRGSQLLKSLREIGFEQHYQAESRGWVLYLEGPTDLSILLAWAKRLEHPAASLLESPYVHYVENQPQKARDHFRGLREAKRDLVGLLLCDRLDRPLQPTSELAELMWERREIENYLCQPDTLVKFARHFAAEESSGPIFEDSYAEAMQESIRALVPPVAFDDHSDEWWTRVKASDEFLDRLFARFFARLGLPNQMPKSNYHRLAPHVAPEDLPPEVAAVLDAIHRTASTARPLS